MLSADFWILSLFFPSEGVEFVFSSNKLDCSIIKKDATAARVVVVEGKELRAIVPVPAGFKQYSKKGCGSNNSMLILIALLFYIENEAFFSSLEFIALAA